MKTEIFIKEFEGLKEEFAVPNKVNLWAESIIRDHSRLSFKLEQEQAVRRAALGAMENQNNG